MGVTLGRTWGEVVNNASVLQPTYRFGVFELNPQSGELRKQGMKIKLQRQPLEILSLLVERPGEIVTREDLQKKLWPADTFVDFEQGLNNAMKRLRAALDDNAETPRFIETLPRRGYRFIAPIQSNGLDARGPITPAKVSEESTQHRLRWRSRIFTYLAVCTAFTVLAIAGFFALKKLRSPLLQKRALTRVTFDEGLTSEATWSPDGRFIAYSSNRGGKFDIWVQQVSGGDPVQVTHGQSQNWQPDWSPDGKYIAYRSEGNGGGIFIIPALGGTGLQRKISSFGYYPRWSPDASRVLLQTNRSRYGNRFYVVDLDGSQAREILGDFLEQHRLGARSAAWHPDGKRISVWTWNGTPGVREEAVGASGGYFPQEPGFWTVSIAQGSGVKTELGDELNTVSQQGQREWEQDLRFNWAPSGDAIYFERTIRGARNLWKVKLDRLTLKATSIERLTTDSGLDSDFAVSRDGKRMAFTAEAHIQRLWMFPFDAARGRLTGGGQPITPPGINTYVHTLTRDGTKLAFSGTRGGHWALWEKTLPDGQEFPIVADNYVRNLASWSPDGKRLAYGRTAPTMDTEKEQVFIWSAETRTEEPLAGPIPSVNRTTIYDWSSDGKDLLVSEFSPETHLFEIWRRPAVPLGQSSPPPRKLASDSYYDLWQPHLSPDEKWLVLVGSKLNTPTGPVCRLFLASGSVGPVIPLLDPGHWDDKPRWSPDGKAIYFLSDRQGFFDVWGTRFDPIKGETLGKPFRVSQFDSPDLAVPQDDISTVELSISRNKLVLNLSQRSGSIWVLDDVDK